MKTTTKILLLIWAWLLWLALQPAHAFYDPAAQRWLNRDPIEESGGKNLYGFVRNRPNQALDPFGWSDVNTPPNNVNGPGPLLPGHGQVPPGYNPKWPTGVDGRGPYLEDPNSKVKYYPHPEDSRHWPHYDDSNGGRYPEKCVKPWPNQKQPPYGPQSPANPWPQPQPPARSSWGRALKWVGRGLGAVAVQVITLPARVPFMLIPSWAFPDPNEPGLASE